MTGQTAPSKWRKPTTSWDKTKKANKIIDELANKSLEYMIWYLSLTDYQLSIASENFM